MRVRPQFSYEETTDVTYGGFSEGGTTVTSGSLDFSNPNFVASDFVGSGNVMGLRVQNNFLLSNEPSMVQLNNLQGAFIEPQLGFQAGNATLQYVFTPVPEPAASFLVLLGFGVALRRKR